MVPGRLTELTLTLSLAETEKVTVFVCDEEYKLIILLDLLLVKLFIIQ